MFNKIGFIALGLITSGHSFPVPVLLVPVPYDEVAHRNPIIHYGIYMEVANLSVVIDPVLRIEHSN